MVTLVAGVVATVSGFVALVAGVVSLLGDLVPLLGRIVALVTSPVARVRARRQRLLVGLLCSATAGHQITGQFSNIWLWRIS